MNDDLELTIHPDVNRLDEEWVEQPRMRLVWSQRLAESKRVLGQARANLEVVESELKLGIRENPGAYNIEVKITEDVIKSAVPLQDEYKEAKRAVIEAQYEVDMVSAAVDAIDDRKHSLQDLVRLWLADYFSTPRSPDEAKERMEEVEKASVRRRGRREE